MVSDTLCPAVHILGTAGQRVLLTITGPGPSFFHTKIYIGQRTRSHRTVGNFCLSVGGRGSLRGDRAWGRGGAGGAGGLGERVGRFIAIG